MQKATKTTAAGVAGVIIGAGITAAAVALSDKNTRKKVGQGIVNVKKQAEKAIKNAKSKAVDKKEVIQKDLKKIDDEEKRMAEDLTRKTEHPIVP